MIKQNLREIDPPKLVEKIDELNKKYKLLLEDFKQSYLNYKEHPDSDEYKSLFDTKKSQLQSTHDECTRITSTTQDAIKNYNISVENRISEVSDTKDEYDDLMSKLKNGKDITRTSNVLVDDYSSNYNKIYFKNLLLIFGVISIIILSMKYSTDSSLSSGNYKIILMLVVALLIIVVLSKYVSFNIN